MMSLCLYIEEPLSSDYKLQPLPSLVCTPLHLARAQGAKETTPTRHTSHSS